MDQVDPGGEDQRGDVHGLAHDHGRDSVEDDGLVARNHDSILEYQAQ